MSNLSGAGIDFDGYEIGSPGGFLDDGSWSSLQSQAEPGWQTIGAPSPNLVAELNSGDSSVVSGGQSFDLGGLYSFNPSTLGESGDDVTFQYSLASGDVVDGIIQYEGNQNNLVLVVDPTTGDGVLHNQSQLVIDLDGYEVRSDAGSLQPGDGDWQSLEDNAGVAGWLEIGAPTANLLGELNSGGSTELTSNTSIPLGNLFSLGGAQDLSLNFSLLDGTVMEGIVHYGDSPPPIAGDYDDSREVAVDDLNLVLFNWDAPGASLPSEWVNDRPAGNVGINELNGVLFNWGKTSSIAAVPEPASGLLLALVSCGMAFAGRRSAVGNRFHEETATSRS